MFTNITPEICALMKERFGHDNLIALATLDGAVPAVRTVNGYYEHGSFYVITNAQSGKMLQIAQNPAVAISGDWFTARGAGENLGYIMSEANKPVQKTLADAFQAWYQNGHINESDPNTCILRVRLTTGILFHHGTRYDIDFSGCAG